MDHQESAPGVGARVRELRASRGLSLRELARRIGATPSTLSAIETGRAGMTLDRFLHIAHALDTGVDDLLGPAAPAPATLLERAHSIPAEHWRFYPPLDWDPALQAAVAAFVEVGYHGATVRDIARRCGLSVPGIYHHHPSKQALLLAILDRTMAELLARVRAARADGGEPAQRFALVVECLALFHTYRRELAFIGASEMRSLSPGNRARIVDARDEVQRVVDAEVADAVAAGAFTTAHPREAARAVVTMCTALVQWYRPGGQLRPENIATQYVGFALDMMRGRHQPGGGTGPTVRDAISAAG